MALGLECSDMLDCSTHLVRTGMAIASEGRLKITLPLYALTGGSWGSPAAASVGVK